MPPAGKRLAGPHEEAKAARRPRQFERIVPHGSMRGAAAGLSKEPADRYCHRLAPATLKGPSFRHAPVTTGMQGIANSVEARAILKQRVNWRCNRRTGSSRGAIWLASAVPSRPESGSAALRDVSDGIANGLKSSGMSAPEIFAPDDATGGDEYPVVDKLPPSAASGSATRPAGT